MGSVLLKYHPTTITAATKITPRANTDLFIQGFIISSIIKEKLQSGVRGELPVACRNFGSLVD
jgi:hypothetical protein